MPDMLTTIEAAALLNVKPAWVRRLCQEGRLPARKQGRDWVIDREDLGKIELQKRGRKPGKTSQ